MTIIYNDYMRQTAECTSQKQNGSLNTNESDVHINLNHSIKKPTKHSSEVLDQSKLKFQEDQLYNKFKTIFSCENQEEIQQTLQMLIIMAEIKAKQKNYEAEVCGQCYREKQKLSLLFQSMTSILRKKLYQKNICECQLARTKRQKFQRQKNIQQQHDKLIIQKNKIELQMNQAQNIFQNQLTKNEIECNRLKMMVKTFDSQIQKLNFEIKEMEIQIYRCIQINSSYFMEENLQNKRKMNDQLQNLGSNLNKIKKIIESNHQSQNSVNFSNISSVPSNSQDSKLFSKGNLQQIIINIGNKFQQNIDQNRLSIQELSHQYLQHNISQTKSQVRQNSVITNPFHTYKSYINSNQSQHSNSNLNLNSTLNNTTRDRRHHIISELASLLSGLSTSPEPHS